MEIIAPIIIIGIIVLFVELFSQKKRNEKANYNTQTKNQIIIEQETENAPIQIYPYKNKYLFTKMSFTFTNNCRQ